MKMINTLLLLAVAGASVGCSIPVKDHKHAVCHKGKTIYVDEAAVDAHIRHGDYGRACYGEQKKGHEGKGQDHDDRDRDERGRDHDNRY